MGPYRALGGVEVGHRVVGVVNGLGNRRTSIKLNRQTL